MGKPVFIIVLNWNGWQDTIECVHSCEKLTYSNFTIVVIDNGSENESLEKLRTALSEYEIIETGENLGFAGGNNIGIKYALDQGAHYIWLLNNDTVVEPDSLNELVKVAETSEFIGIVGSKIFLHEQQDTLHFAGGTVDLQTGATTHLGAFEKDQEQYDHLTNVDYVTGCSLLVKRQVIEDIGLMPEEYFLYYEETDWCMRARNEGFSIRMAPRSRVCHKVSGSIDYFSAAKLYYLVRNRLYFLRNHGKDLKWSKRMLADTRNCLKYLLTGQIKKAGMIPKAYYHWITNHTGPLQ